MTAGSMTRSLLNHLPKLLGRDRRNLFALLQAPIALLCGFFQGGHLLRYSAVLPLGVIRGLDVDLPKLRAEYRVIPNDAWMVSYWPKEHGSIQSILLRGGRRGL